MRGRHLRLVTTGSSGGQAVSHRGGAAGAAQPGSLDAARPLNARRALAVGPADLGHLPSVYARDVRYRDPVLSLEGLDQVVAFFEGLFKHSLDHHLRLGDELYSGQTYTATWVMSGIFLGFPYQAPGMSICTFRPGEARISFQRNYYSEGDLWASLPAHASTVAGLRRFFAETVIVSPTSTSASRRQATPVAGGRLLSHRT